MEDCNLIAADCVALSCCCQCLILQFLIYVFLKMPRRLLHRTKDYARRKLTRMRRRKRVETELKESTKLGEMFAQMYHDDESMCIDIGGMQEFKKGSVNYDRTDCIVEIERVLDEYCANGEFGFGSFWRKEVSKTGSPPPPSSLLSLSPRYSSLSYSCPWHSSSSLMRSMSAAAAMKKKQKKRRKEEEGLKVVEIDLVEIVNCLSDKGSFDRLLDCESCSPAVTWRRNMTLT